MCILPSVECNSPASNLSRVVLPEPLDPNIDVSCPVANDVDMFLMAGLSPLNENETFCKMIFIFWTELRVDVAWHLGFLGAS